MPTYRQRHSNIFSFRTFSLLSTLTTSPPRHRINPNNPPICTVTLPHFPKYPSTTPVQVPHLSRFHSTTALAFSLTSSPSTFPRSSLAPFKILSTSTSHSLRKYSSWLYIALSEYSYLMRPRQPSALPRGPKQRCPYTDIMRVRLPHEGLSHMRYPS